MNLEINIEKVISTLKLLRDETEAEGLKLGDVRYVSAKNGFSSSLSEQGIEVPVFFKKEWLENYWNSRGQIGETEIKNEFIEKSFRFTEKLKQASSKRK